MRNDELYPEEAGKLPVPARVAALVWVPWIRYGDAGVPGNGDPADGMLENAWTFHIVHVTVLYRSRGKVNRNNYRKIALSAYLWQLIEIAAEDQDAFSCQTQL